MPDSFYENQVTPQANDTPPTPLNEEAQAESSDTTDTSTGQFVASVFTANQLYPVVNAVVSITAEGDENNEVSDTSTTDRSGRTKTFTLPAPSSSMSQEPTVASPFAQYRETVTHPDYFNAVIENVQLFGGILTQLPVNLIPLPELDTGDTTKITIIPKQNL